MLAVVIVSGFLCSFGHSLKLGIHTVRGRIDEACSACSDLRGDRGARFSIVSVFVSGLRGEEDLGNTADDDQRTADKLEGRHNFAEHD